MPKKKLSENSKLAIKFYNAFKASERATEKLKERYLNSLKYVPAFERAKFNKRMQSSQKYIK